METENLNFYFLEKYILVVGICLFFLFGLFGMSGAVHAYDFCSPVFKGFFCSDQCSYSGQARCADNLHREICGNYDSDEYLEWSPLKSCLGDTSCGYGNCKDDERPRWHCLDGSCRYDCVYDKNCALSSCQCSSGSCCDGCHYRPPTWSCGSESQTQYDCPWGLTCGADVGKRTRIRLKYCSGDSAQCNGRLGDWQSWSGWKIADKCESGEVCRIGSPYCHYSADCPSSLKPVPKKSQVENNGLIISFLGEKEGHSSDWGEKVEVEPGQYIDFLLVLVNKSEKALDNINLKAEFPKGLIYKDDLKIAKIPLNGDLESGLSLGFFPSGTVKTITFRAMASLSPGAGDKEKNVVIQASGKNLSASSSVKISFSGLQEQEAAVGSNLSFLRKWYNWILIILAAVVLFYFIKGFLNWFKKS